MIALQIPLRPIAYARMRIGNAGHTIPTRQRRYMTDVGVLARAAMRGAKPLSGPVFVQVRFTFLVPNDWAKKGSPRWRPHDPDMDNLEKLLWDSLNGIMWEDDCQIVKLEAEKVYGFIEGTVLTVAPA